LGLRHLLEEAVRNLHAFGLRRQPFHEVREFCPNAFGHEHAMRPNRRSRCQRFLHKEWTFDS
jgi:hypothetical protein